MHVASKVTTTGSPVCWCCCCQHSLSASVRNTQVAATILGSQLQPQQCMLYVGTPGRPLPELPGTSGHVPAAGRDVEPATARPAPQLPHSAGTETRRCLCAWITFIKSLPFCITTFSASVTTCPDKYALHVEHRSTLLLTAPGVRATDNYWCSEQCKLTSRSSYSFLLVTTAMVVKGEVGPS